MQEIIKALAVNSRTTLKLELKRAASTDETIRAALQKDIEERYAHRERLRKRQEQLRGY